MCPLVIKVQCILDRKDQHTDQAVTVELSLGNDVTAVEIPPDLEASGQCTTPLPIN